jgi:NADPH:quinone reductase-like Zn-dependent oxidoreductase
MKAIVRDRYGSAEVLSLGEVPTPTCRDDGFGAFAEYARVPEKALAPKPAHLTFEEAAAVPLAGRVALQGLRDEGGIGPGRKVLVNGASGGVGTFAVQIAKAHGAEVTGVRSGRNAGMVRTIGADHVIDYTREDFTRSGRTWDLILDAAAHRSVLANRRALSAEGVYVMVGGVTM